MPCVQAVRALRTLMHARVPGDVRGTLCVAGVAGRGSVHAQPMAYSYGLYSYGIYSYGLYSYGADLCMRSLWPI